MKKFNVTYNVTTQYTAVIEAEDIEEAHEKFYAEDFVEDSVDVEDIDVDYDSVEFSDFEDED